MAAYRKKPVEIWAEQFHPDKKPWPHGVEAIGRVPVDPTSRTGFRIQTLEGWMVVSIGDWIIEGVKAERYPCKPDIFEMTYEPVPAPPELTEPES